MHTQDASALTCRHCRYFHHEGRRGGHCQKLDAHVRGDWKPCPLMIPSFKQSWETLEEMLPLQAQGSLASVSEPSPVLSVTNR